MTVIITVLDLFYCQLMRELLDTVMIPSRNCQRNRDQYRIPLKIISYEELYGWTMDAIVKEIGLKRIIVRFVEFS